MFHCFNNNDAKRLLKPETLKLLNVETLIKNDITQTK